MVEGDTAASSAAPVVAQAATAAPTSDNEGAAQGQAGAQAAGGEGARARRAQQAAKETVQDELAQETRRITLLDAVEHQLKAAVTRSRLLLACNISDDKKAVAQIETEFASWAKKLVAQQTADDREEEEGAPKPIGFGGFFIIQPNQALHFLEGPTDQIFAALKYFQSFCEMPAGGQGADTTAATPRGTLVSNLRIIYFTEVHGVQTMNGWHSFHHLSAKSMGGPQLFQDEESCTQAVFTAYRKLLGTNVKVWEGSNNNEDEKAVQTQLKKFQDNLPTLDELTALLHKTAAEYFFSYAEFDKAFCAPFHLVLQSELLWPMPPPLSY